MSYISINLENLTELKSRRGSPTTGVIATILGLNYPVVEAYSVYLWVESSTATPDNVEIVASDLGDPNVGRWIRIDLNVAPQVNSDWNASSGPAAILNKPTLFSGAYADLTGKPSIPAAQVNADWNAASGLPQILNRPTLAAVATSGSYNDLSNKPTIPTVNAPTQSAATRSLNTAFQISASRAAIVAYSVQLTVTASIAGGQNGDVILEIASDSGFTSNVQTIAVAGVGQTYTLAVALQGVQPQTGVLFGFVPAGYYTRIRTVNNTGTPSYSFRSGQETLL